MDQTLRQLGELLLGAVPTVILLASLYILYTFLVHRPLTAVLAERRNRTQGAMEKARADIAAAEARTADYEQRLREARQKIFKNQEARRQQATQSRTQAVNEARTRAQEQVKQARAAMEEDKQQAMSNCNGRGPTRHRYRARRIAPLGVTHLGWWPMKMLCSQVRIPCIEGVRLQPRRNLGPASGHRLSNAINRPLATAHLGAVLLALFAFLSVAPSPAYAQEPSAAPPSQQASAVPEQKTVGWMRCGCGT